MRRPRASRSPLHWAFLWIACLVACSAERPDVLLVTLDTVRADHLGAYGYERNTSPHLDRLAAEGALFTTVYAPTGATCPSHATMFTGRSPLAHGLLRNGFVLPESELVLAERLRNAGYRTAAFLSSYPLKARFGFAQGFEHYDDDFSGGTSTVDVHGEWEGRRVVERFDRLGAETADRALDWLNDLESEAPAFVWLHLFDPHFPYGAPEPDGSHFVEPEWSETDPAYPVARYDGEIRYADAQLARVWQGLAARAGAAGVLVMILGDHGEGLKDHGWMHHNRYLYEEELRVPWVLHWPGKIPPGEQLPVPAHLADVTPTLLGLLGLAHETPGDSVDWSALLTRGDPNASAAAGPGRSLWLQRPYYREGRAGMQQQGYEFGVRRGRWKYLEAQAEGRRELYDLERDPAERSNLAAREPERVLELSDRVARWRRVQLAMRSRAELSLSPDDEEALRALGYAD